MREVSRVADKRLVAETEGSEIDGDLLARREHYLALPQGRPDHLDAERVPRDVLAQRAELPEQVAEQLGRVARVDELFHTQRGPAVERRRAALRRGRRVTRVDRVRIAVRLRAAPAAHRAEELGAVGTLVAWNNPADVT